MGMQVLAYDPYVSEDRMRSMNVGRAETADEVFERADFVSLHVPRAPPDDGSRERGRPGEDEEQRLSHKRARGIVDETASTTPEGWHYRRCRARRIRRGADDDSDLHAPQRGGDAPPRGEHREAQDRAGITAAEQAATASGAPCRYTP